MRLRRGPCNSRRTRRAPSASRSHHFGAAGVYARIASRQGLIGLVTSLAQGILLVPTRAAEPVLGTNPIAFAAPVAVGSRNTDFVLDMATTTAAANRVKVKALRGQTVPAGWVVDGQGAPVTEPQAARTQVFDSTDGGLTPLGGSPDGGSHKGYGLSLLAQVLGGTLNGVPSRRCTSVITGRPIRPTLSQSIHPSSAAIGFEPAYGNAVSASAQIEWELPQMRAIPQRADIRID